MKILVIYQGKLLNDSLIAGHDSSYLALTNTETPNPQHYALWRQSVGTQNYNGSMDIYKVSPASFLLKDIFKTSKNVATGQNIYFPFICNIKIPVQYGWYCTN